jgi:5-methyltetrahydropteroyltriglutamate--homocysteine methyltransferase
MEWNERHSEVPHSSFDGGDLDCGSGLLLLIRKQLDPLHPGQLLEIRSTEISVDEDLPAWCRLTGNELLSKVRQHAQRSFLVRKGGNSEPPPEVARPIASDAQHPILNPPRVVPIIQPLSVMGIGSWPRPVWLMRALGEYLEGRLSEAEFQQTADDAVRLAIAAQERAGVDVVTDGEQRRDSYASFVGSRLENCQLVPITDLLPYVNDPEKFERELRALDVPAAKIRHPAVLGPLRRKQPLALHELAFARSITDKPVKIALPGPYLLSRTLWMDCLTEKPYPTREPLIEDIVTILREEIRHLLDRGAAIIQLDEPVLSEVVFGAPAKDRSFMCGALAQRREPAEELVFAAQLLQRVLDGFPRNRMALHVCRGNWSKDERVALAGDYRPLLPLFNQIPVGTFFLELCTPRAGELEILADLPKHCRIGIGVVNQKLDRVETVDEITIKAEKAIALFGAERVLLNTDCGFATFADNPVASAEVAEAKLRAIAQASRELRQRHGA